LPFLETSLAPDHPAAQGHFPGNPIIPGAVLLAEVLRTIGQHVGVRLAPCRIRSAKFPHPARPGERLSIEFLGDPTGAIRFRCTVGGATVVSGEVQCIQSAA
jgi:3-hydroxymyristoyl/3-hydroxydecanoyl-(acyl carrier protein) dehydratase